MRRTSPTSSPPLRRSTRRRSTATIRRRRARQQWRAGQDGRDQGSAATHSMPATMASFRPTRRISTATPTRREDLPFDARGAAAHSRRHGRYRGIRDPEQRTGAGGQHRARASTRARARLSRRRRSTTDDAQSARDGVTYTITTAAAIGTLLLNGSTALGLGSHASRRTTSTTTGSPTTPRRQRDHRDLVRLLGHRRRRRRRSPANFAITIDAGERRAGEHRAGHAEPSRPTQPRDRRPVGRRRRCRRRHDDHDAVGRARHAHGRGAGGAAVAAAAPTR